MGDIEIENYKKSVARILETWGSEAARIGKELAPIEAELDKLEAIKNPGADDKKKIDALKKKREACHKRLADVAASLELNLKVIQISPKADPKELEKVPAWMREIIKQKGLPLGKDVSIAPDIGFDFKAKKLTKVGITIHWKGNP